MEVSIDEPLNVDWDGNELLLSDILGTDEDIIYRDLENEVERKLLRKALGKMCIRDRTNTIPNTGITLPFVSYGGTSVVFLLLEMGIALSVSRGVRKEH